MIRHRQILLMMFCACVGCVGFALFLQHFRHITPCPLCVLQRYAFLFIAAFALLGVVLNKPKIAAFFAFLTALAGIVVAGMQMWAISHPSLICGEDPLETFLNQLFAAKWLPSVFKAEGLCSASGDIIFGLSLPEWALVWFIGLAGILLSMIFSRSKRHSRA